MTGAMLGFTDPEGWGILVAATEDDSFRLVIPKGQGSRAVLNRAQAAQLRDAIARWLAEEARP